MLRDIHLRPPLPADHLEIAAIVASLIPRHLGRGLSDEGTAILRENTNDGVIGAKIGGLGDTAWSPVLVAVSGARIIGFGAVRDDTHITQLQVIEEWHGRGIGHRIARALIAEIVRRHPHVREVTLNAAEGALVAYLRMGFHPIGPRFNWHGIVAQPMALSLARFGSEN